MGWSGPGVFMSLPGPIVGMIRSMCFRVSLQTGDTTGRWAGGAPESMPAHRRLNDVNPGNVRKDTLSPTGACSVRGRASSSHGGAFVSSRSDQTVGGVAMKRSLTLAAALIFVLGGAAIAAGAAGAAGAGALAVKSTASGASLVVQVRDEN